MTKTKSVLLRFLKGLVTGAISSMALVPMTTPTIWNDFSSLLNSLAVAGAFGGLTGLLLALEKWANWKE